MEQLHEKRMFLSNLSIDRRRIICYDIDTTQGEEAYIMNWAALIWFILLVAFLMAEAASVAVVSLWFAAGALVAMVASWLGAQLWLQVVLFVVVSGAMLAALRPIVKKLLKPKLTRTNIDAVIGTTGMVTGSINNTLSQGQVKLGAMEWTARSTSGEPIEAGTQVTVDRIEGVKVYVSPVEEKVNV